MSTTQWLPIEFLEGEENRPPKESVGFPSSTEFWLKLIRVENSIYPAICEHDFLCRSSIERVHSLSLSLSHALPVVETWLRAWVDIFFVFLFFSFFG